MLGVSEHRFRRYRDPCEESGLDGLIDRGVGEASPSRVPKAELERMLSLYRGFTAAGMPKHFHEHLERDHSFACARRPFAASSLGTAYARASGDEPALGGPSQQGRRVQLRLGPGVAPAWLLGRAPLDLAVTMDDATSTNYSAILVDEEWTTSRLTGLLEVFVAEACRRASTPIVAATTS